MSTIGVRRLRLMLITHDLAIGGLQRVVLNICKTIDRERFDVSVLCLRGLGAFAGVVEGLGIEVILLPGKHGGVDYWAFRRVARILRERRIDVIHTHNTQPLVDGGVGAILAGVRMIVHTDHARKFPDKRRYMFAEWVLSHAVYRVVGVSTSTSEDLIRYERISRGKIRTIPNGIDETIYSGPGDRQKVRRELGISRDGLVIGVGVRLSRQKGLTYLLQAMPEVIGRYPEVRLVIAGEGECEDALKREARDLGIGGHTLFIGPRLDMPDVLKAFDLYVLPSLWEGLPMALLEAMASGCPIVATDLGGNRMALTHGESGSLVEASNPKALAGEIIRVLADEQLRARYAGKARENFASRFGARAMTARYEKLYLREDSLVS